MLVTKPQFDPKFGDYVESLVAASPISERINLIALQHDHIFTKTNKNPASKMLSPNLSNQKRPITTTRLRQVKEIVDALENSGTRFLLSLCQRPSSPINMRPNGGYMESMEVFVNEFFDRTVGKGKIIGWAPQVAILSHPAVGGFISHCGWNSILESLWFGVPIATWPLYAEQQFNAFELVKELGLAVDIKLDYAMDFNSEKDQVVMSAQEIEVKIRKLMEHDSDLRKRAKEIREKSRKASMDGGSSYFSLGGLINHVIDNTL